ncbi:MAG: monovalent cation/H+ antiporter complex subunit F [Phycisphaeraceae bacterium]|nr:monovalent cation/H+ antiporter complex subunit F [Phycisphaeraceae bacterium]
MTFLLPLAAAASDAATTTEPAGALSDMIVWTVDFGIAALALGMLACLWRLVRGPHLADRALALDTLGVQLIGVVVLFSIRFATVMFLDGALVLSLLGFAGTVAIAQYIGRHINDRDHREVA